MTRTEPSGPALLERAGELALVAAAVERAAAGRGGTLLVEGPAGIGKTRLLDAARSAAAGGGFRVLAARGSPLEREFGFGVVRGLLEPAARTAMPGADEGAARLAARVLDPDGTTATPSFAALHGVYWLVVALAEQGPLLLAVDDGHWADGPSLRVLHHLARRIDHLPVLIALATRPHEPDADTELLEALRDEPGSTVLRPAPLSADGTVAVLRRVLGDGVQPAFADACHEVAGGNPLLLTALVGSLHQAGVAPVAAGVDAVRERAPAIVSAFVLPRLRHL
ncbi:MAG TPA: AAA family ATPase, partial [Pseudonocardia sp.]|nr:AAA family ATPase [Pseudonocardia sp.]